ncbi:hypothetical protein [Methylobacterium sp. E-066]|uniref:hypothetical protein n=1 Tax=Methylobacterium sp. E-066 TaxID=2836584 RepID=UPI001FBB528A|nr:hypothetical protein [Methylobacterium sp. E-066]MCJ2142972.1 hypothetical protein [Methylobacterium sp. E-066]
MLYSSVSDPISWTMLEAPAMRETVRRRRVMPSSRRPFEGRCPVHFWMEESDRDFSTAHIDRNGPCELKAALTARRRFSNQAFFGSLDGAYFDGARRKIDHAPHLVEFICEPAIKSGMKIFYLVLILYSKRT